MNKTGKRSQVLVLKDLHDQEQYLINQRTNTLIVEHFKKLLSARLHNQFDDQIVKWTEIINQIPFLPVETLGEITRRAALNISQLKAETAGVEHDSDFLKELDQQKNNLIDIYILARNSARNHMEQNLNLLTNGWDRQLPAGVGVVK